jgi:hypothetical protein
MNTKKYLKMIKYVQNWWKKEAKVLRIQKKNNLELI